MPTETEGRYRDRKPYYINRVRVSCEWNNKYNQNHYNDENPPPKTVQGYKFNIFYPDLYDKQKTPQYELLPTDNPDYCVIKFKAGPPYKDIAFKILRKEWDFSEKSGCETIFTKGILHLYFNFKKPRYRIWFFLYFSININIQKLTYEIKSRQSSHVPLPFIQSQPTDSHLGKRLSRPLRLRSHQTQKIIFLNPRTLQSL